MNKGKLLLIVLLAIAVGFFLGKRAESYFYLDRCLDLGGGSQPDGYPICVVEKYLHEPDSFYNNVSVELSKGARFICDDNSIDLTIISKGVFPDGTPTMMAIENNSGIVLRFKKEEYNHGQKFGDAAGNYVVFDDQDFTFASKDMIKCSGKIKSIKSQDLQIFKGYFSYMADANMFVSCDKSLRLTVAMQDKYIDLERMYLQNELGGEPAYVELAGSIIKQQGMEGDKLELAINVSSIVRFSPNESCDLKED